MLIWKTKNNIGNPSAADLRKISKSRKQILKFSFGPKNEQKYLCISALASKMGQIIKIMAPYHAN
jgi:hypothetical protein